MQQLSLKHLTVNVRYNNNALTELNDCIEGLLHLGPNVITFRSLLHLGPNINVITFRPSTKAALNPRVFRWSVPFEFSFCGGKTRFTHAIAANKRANSHNFKIKNLNLQLLSSPFT